MEGGGGGGGVVLVAASFILLSFCCCCCCFSTLFRSDARVSSTRSRAASVPANVNYRISSERVRNIACSVLSEISHIF